MCAKKNKFIQNFFIVIGHGSNDTSDKFRTLTKAGQHTGLQLLLNVEQTEYCSIIRKWHGAGFRVHIHDPNALPNDLISGYLNLSPGFSTNIVIKPTIYDRRTEKLHRCVSSVASKLSALKPKKYVQLACFAECIIFNTYKRCGCSNSFYEEFKSIEKVVPKSCNTPKDMLCMKETVWNMVYTNLYETCDHCKLPCKETQYEYQMSSSLLRPHVVKESFKLDDSTILKNYVLVRFSLESMTTLICTETEAYTITELITYLGGIAGLFLGMSFVSFYEIFHQILFNIVSRIWKVYKNTKLKKILKVILRCAFCYSLLK